jgi:hypothetical protein
MNPRPQLGAFAAAWLVSATLAAQTAPFDAAAYASAKAAATRTFLNSNLPVQQRLAAVQNLGSPDAATRAKLLQIGVNKQEDGRIRLESLRRVRFGDPWLNAVLAILADDADGDAELDAQLIRELGKRSTSFPPPVMRQRIQDTLRGLMDDPRDKVRLHAFRALVANHDQLAAGVLDERLRSGANIPIPTAEAINLLYENGATGHFAAIRPYLQNPDPEVQSMAALALGPDQESRQRIMALALSPGAAVKTREFALRGLAQNDEKFAGYATLLVEDRKTDPAVLDAAMTTIVGRMNYNPVPVEQQLRFARAVDALATGPKPTDPAALKTRANAVELMAYLRQAFPEIRRFYENR